MINSWLVVWEIFYTHTHTQTHTHTHTQPFYGPFSGARARRELLDFMVQGKINRGRHTDRPAGRHSIRTNQCPPPLSPHFLQAGYPSCGPTNSVKALKITSTFRLGRRCWSPPQWCYQNRLHTVIFYTEENIDTAMMWPSNTNERCYISRYKTRCLIGSRPLFS